jgi:hypothetical protein
VSGAELQGDLVLLRFKIYAYDRVGSDDVSRHNCGKANSPVPKMAMLEPFEAFNEFITVPAPVCMPQPNVAKISNGKSLGTLTRLRFGESVCGERRLSKEMPAKATAVHGIAAVQVFSRRAAWPFHAEVDFPWTVQPFL